MKTGVFQIRKDERFDAMQKALAKKNVGENKTERVIMGLEQLCKMHKVSIPA